MYRMAYRWTGNQQDAEDLVQEVLVKLTNRVEELNEVEKLRPWLIKILYHSFVDAYRKQARSLEIIEADLLDSFQSPESEDSRRDSILDQAASPDPVTQLSQQRRLEYALNELEPDQRDVLLLHDAEGYTDSEIAEILGISKGTVKSRLHRAREKMKKIL